MITLQISSFVSTLILFIWLAKKLPFQWSYLIIFSFAIVADAFSNKIFPTSWQTNIAIFFVILGDTRFFILLERFNQKSNWLFRAMGLSIVVPIASGVIQKIHPQQNIHMVYLTYELLFIIFVTTLTILRKKSNPFIRNITLYFLIQYSLWAVADVLILSAIPLGTPLREIPNILYYGGFLLFVAHQFQKPTYGISVKRYRRNP